MGNLLRRVLAFVLGVVFTISAASASVVGGAYWAYKNIKPVGIASDDPGLGDLRDQSIEDLMFLLNGALNDPDKYTLARLESEYGLDLEKILKNLGIEDVNKNSKDWQALTAISLFSIKDGIPALLGEVKLRALYNFIPSLTGKRLKDVLSPEAQEKLGDYTLIELFESDETTKETGLFKAIKNIKLGAVLPEYFDCEYNEETHEFDYTLSESEEAQKIPALGVFGNVSLGVISNAVSGGDIMDELMEGGLSSISQMPLEDILTAIAKTVSPEIGEKVSSYAKFLNGARLCDLFRKNKEGKYEFYYIGVLGDVKIGYLFGLNDDDNDGIWVDGEGKPAKDLLQVAANLKLGTVFENKGALATVRELLGDVTVGMVLDMAGVEEGSIPPLDGIRGLQVSELLKSQGDQFDANAFVKDLVTNLSDSLGDRTLGELIFKEGEQPENANAIVKALFDLKISDFVREEYSLEAFIATFRDALGNVAVGDILGTEKNPDGTWKTDDKVLGLILDFSFDNIFDVIQSDYSAKEVINALLPEITLGGVVVAFTGFVLDEENGRFYKEQNGEKRYLSVELSEFFDNKLSDMAGGLLDKNDPFDTYAELEKPMVGDIMDFILDWTGESASELEYILVDGDGSYVWENNPRGAASDFLSTSIAAIAKDVYGGGKEMLGKDVGYYVDLVGAVARFTAKKGGYTGDIDAITEAVEDLMHNLFSGPLNDVKVNGSDVTVENIAETAGEVVGIILPNNKSAIDKTVALVNDLLSGTVAGFGFNQNTKVYALINDITELVNEFIGEGKAKDIINAAMNDIAELYGEGRLGEFVDASKAIEIHGIIDAVVDVITTATDKQHELIGKIAELLKDAVSGTIGTVGFNQNTTVAALLNDITALVNEFMGDGKAKDIINAAMNDIAELYGDGKLGEFVDATKAIKIDGIVDAVVDVITTATDKKADLIASIAELVKDTVSGTVGSVGLNQNTLISTLATDLNNLVNEILSDGKAKDVINTVLEEIAALYAGEDKKMGAFVEASKAIEVKKLIGSFEKVFSYFPSAASVTDRIIALSNAALDGTIGDLKFDFNALVKEATTTELIIGGSIAAVTGTLLYIFANDTLLTVIEKTLGPDYTVGKLIAEPMGYTLSDGKYLFEDEENALASVLFEQTVYDIANDEFDFKGMFYDYLMIDDIAMIAKAVVTKYAKNDIGATVNDGLDGIADIYNETHVTKIGDATMSAKIYDVVGTVGKVVAGIIGTKSESNKTLVLEITELVQDLFSGEIGDFGFNQNTKITALINDIKSIIDSKKSSAEIDELFAAIDGLYGKEEVLGNMGPATKNVYVADIITVFEAVLKLAVKKQKDVIAASGELARDLISGTVSECGLNANTPISVLLIDVKAITDLAISSEKVKNAVGVALSGLAENYAQADEGLLGNFVNASKQLDINGIVTTAKNVVAAVSSNSEEKAAQVEKLINDMFSGEIGEFGFNQNTKVATIIDDIKSLIGSRNETVNAAFANVEELYKDVLFGSFVKETLELNVDDVIDCAAGITGTVKEIGKERSDNIGALLKELVEGKVNKPIFNDLAAVNDLAAELDAIVGTFNFNGKNIVSVAITGFGTLYENVTIHDFVKASKELTVAAVVNYAEKVAVEILKDNDKGKDITEKVAAVLRTAIAGTIVKPELNKESQTSDVFTCVKALTDIFYQNNVTDTVYAELKNLYKDKIIYNIVEDSKNLNVDSVIISFTNIVVSTKVIEKEQAEAIMVLAIELFDQTLATVIFNDEALVNIVAQEVVDIVNAFKLAEIPTAIINEIVNGIGDLYNGVALRRFVEETKNLEVDAIVDYVEEVTLVILGERESKQSARKGRITPKSDAGKKVSLFASLLRDVFDGKISAPALDDKTMFDDVIADVQAITDSFNLKHDVLTTAYAELKKLYADKQLVKLVAYTLDLEFDRVIDSVGTVVKSVKGIKAEQVDAIATLAKDIVDGKIGSPNVDNDVMIDDVVTDVQAITDSFGWKHDVLTTTYTELKKLYADKQLVKLIAYTLDLETDDVVVSVAEIVKSTKAIKNENQIEYAKDIVTYIIKGKLSGIAIDTDAQVSEIAVKTQKFVDTFNLGKAAELVDCVLEETATLFNGAKLASAGTFAKGIYVDALIDSTAKITKVAFKSLANKDYYEKVDAVAGLAKELLTGTIVKAGISKEAVVSDVSTRAFDIYEMFFGGKAPALESVLKELSEQINALYPSESNTFGTFVADSKKLDVNAAFASASKVFGHISAIKSVTDRIFRLADVSMSGTFGDLKFDFNAFAKEATTTELVVVVSVVAVTGTVLYFAANPTLVSVTTYIFGKDKKLGTLIATAAGYEEVDGKYLFEGEENALASMIFDLTVQDVLTKGFDFKGALYDYLTIDDIALFAKAVESKYVPDGKAKNIVNASLDAVADIYDGAHVKDIVDATKQAAIADITAAAVDITNAATDNKRNDMLVALKTFVDGIIKGTLGKPEIDKTIKTSEFVENIQAITDSFDFEYEILTAVYTEIKGLYDGKLLADIGKDTLALDIDDVVISVSTVVELIKDISVTKIDALTDIVTYVLTGKLSKVQFAGEAEISVIVVKTQTFVDLFDLKKAQATVDSVFEQTAIVFGGATLRNAKDTVPAIEVDSVIGAVAEVTKVAFESLAEKKYYKKIDAISALARLLVKGTVSKPGFDENVTVSATLGAVKNFTDLLYTNNIIESAYTEVIKLYDGDENYLKNIGKITLELNMSDIVVGAANVIENIDKVTTEQVTAIETLLLETVSGKVKEVKFNDTAKVSDVANEVNDIVVSFKPNEKAEKIVSSVLAGLGKLYSGVTLNQFAAETKNREIDNVITYVADVTDTVVEVLGKDYTKHIDAAVEVANYVLTGTVTSVKFAGEAEISEIIAKTQVLVDTFDLKKAQATIDSVLEQSAVVFDGATLRNAKDTVPAIEVDSVIGAVAEVTKVAFESLAGKRYYQKIDAVADLAKSVLAGTVSKPGISNQAVVSEVADNAYNVYNMFVGNKVPVLGNVLKELADQVGELYPSNENTFKTFVSDSKNLDVKDVITAANTVLGHIDQTKKVTDRLAVLANVSLSGTIKSVKFDFDGFVKEAKWYELAVVGGVTAAAGTVMYFVANPTLVSIADRIFKDKTIGEVAATYAGYEKVEDKYLFDGEENALATTIFELTVKEVLTKGFDFKGTFKDKLFIDDIAMIAKAVESKYAPEKAKKIAGLALDSVAKLYDETLVKDIASATKGMELYKLFSVAANAVNVMTDRKYDGYVAATEKLLDDVFFGTLTKCGINDTLWVSDIVKDVNLIVGTDKENINAIFNAVANAYDKTPIREFVSATKALEICNVISVATTVVNELTNNKYDNYVSAADKLLNDIVIGTVSKFGINGTTSIAAIVKDINLFYNDNAKVNAVFDSVANAYGEATLKEFKSATKALEICNVISVATTVVNELTDNKYDNYVSAADKLLNDVVIGTVSKFGINGTTSISDVIDDINMLVGENNEDVNAIFNAVSELYAGEELANIKSATKSVSADGLVEVARVVVDFATEKQMTEKVTAVADVLKELLYGKVNKVKLDNSARVWVIVENVATIVKGANKAADAILTELADLYDGVYMQNIVEDTKSIEWQRVIASAMTVTGKYKGLNDKLGVLYDYLAISLYGTIGKPEFKYSNLVDLMSDEAKLVVAAVAVGTGVVLYKANNALLVKIAKYAFGTDSTWGDKFASLAGYTLNETTGNYERSDGLCNTMMNELFNMNIVESLKTENDIVGTLSAFVTLGNVIGVKAEVQNKLESFMQGAEFVCDEKGNWSIDKIALDHVEDILLNTTLKEVLDNKDDFDCLLSEKLDSLTIADLGVGSVIRKVADGKKVKGFKTTAEYDAETGKWTFDGSFDRLFGVALNTTVYDLRFAKSTYGSLSKLAFEEMKQLTLGDIVCEIIDIAMARKTGRTITSTFDETTGEWTVDGKYSEVIERFVNENLYTFYKNSIKHTRTYLLGENLLGGVRVGNLLGKGYNKYNSVTDKWTDENGNVDFGTGFKGIMLRRVYNIKIGEVTGDDGFNVDTLTKGMYLGDVFGYTCSSADEKDHEHSDTCKWFNETDVTESVGGTPVKAMLEADPIYATLCGISLDDLMSGKDMFDSIKELSLGELMGYKKVSFTDGETTTYKFYEFVKDGKVPVVDIVDGYAYRKIGTAELPVLTATLAKISVAKFMDGDGVNEIMNEIEGLKIGDILRYTYDESAGKWIDGNGADVGGMLAKFCNHTLKEIKNENELKKIVNEMKLSDVLGADAINSNAVLAKLGDTEIGSLSDKINEMYIGEVLNYNKTETKHNDYQVYTDLDGNKYYNDSAMAEDGTFEGSWKKVEDGSVAEGISKTLDTNGRYKYAEGKYLVAANVWKHTKGGTEEEIKGIRSILANFRIGELDDSDFDARIDSAIDNLYLGEIIAINDSSPIILKKLKLSRIKDVENDIIGIKVGELMGFTYVTDTATGTSAWYNGDGNEIGEIPAMMADFTIGEIGENDFETKLKAKTDNLHLSTFVSKDSCSVFDLFTDEEFKAITLNSLGNALNGKLESPTLGTAATLGIIETSLFEDTDGTLTRVGVNVQAANGNTPWRNIDAKVFIRNLINEAFDY